MPIGATTSEGSGGENIQHFSTIRFRAVGVGLLRLKVYSLDDVKTKDLVPLQLQSGTRIQPNRIVNFVEQRASFEIWTENLDEWLRINRISVYLKEIYTSHPAA
jgi:hypothetical protein